MMTTASTNDQIVAAGEVIYEQEVVRILNQILNTQTGAALGTKVRAHGSVLITDDYPGVDPSETNQHFQPGRSKAKVAIIAFYPQNETLTTTRLLYNGKEITKRQLRNWQKNYTGFQPDELLVHELVHAARWLGGDFKATPMTGVYKGYETEEEYFAVLVANIYISEKGGSFESFRKSHALLRKPEMTQLEGETSFSFLLEDENYRLIGQFCAQHPTIAPMIAQAPARFNPIRDYYALH